MLADDGWLIRIRPFLGRLDRAQVTSLCNTSLAHGNGQIDLTNRGALQIRGVADNGLEAIVEDLAAAGLVSPDPEEEARGHMVLPPDWTEDDDTHRIARALRARSTELPKLPSKIGFAIDAGPAPALTGVSADFRIERGIDGRLLLRPDGREEGISITADQAWDAILRLTRWFVDSGGKGRIARHDAPLPSPYSASIAAIRPRNRAEVLAAAPGAFFGTAFGRIEARRLHDLLSLDSLTAVRVTPWRGLILENVAKNVAGLGAIRATDPLLRVDACPGLSACPQATVVTRDLALRLAPWTKGSLHVSGCSKGCARPHPADIVLTGRDGRFDLARRASAGAPPVHEALDATQVAALFGAPDAARL